MFNDLFGTDADTQLGIYLNDHRAGAVGASALARRSAAANTDNAIGEYLGGRFERELTDERALLDALRERLGVRSNPVKQYGARLAELLGRAKLNGALTGPTPLSRVIELEALIAGVAAKRQLWRTAIALPDVDTELFEEQLTRADEQLDRLQELHRWATHEAFGTKA